MLAQLPTPTVSTNGNGNGNHNEVKIAKPMPNRTAKRSGMPKVKRAKKITLPPEVLRESRIEEFKDKLNESATGNTGLLTNCYMNWLDHQIKDEETDIRLLTARSGKGEQHAVAAHKAWQRARRLFKDLAPVVLDDLRKDIARQIELEFKNVDELAAADVPAGLRNVDLFDLMEHIN